MESMGGFVIRLILPCLLLAACQHLPGGSKIGIEFQFGSQSPSFEQAEAWRKANPVDFDRVLINGEIVNRADYPAIVRISMGGGSCTATVVGPRTILTAAHCAKTGQSISFKTISGKSYVAKGRQAPGYPKEDLDLLLADTDTTIDVAPLAVRLDRFEQVNMPVILMGYGCTQPGGSGGNDGNLRKGDSKVSGSQGYDLILKGPNGAALCYGDSGGPVLHNDGKQTYVIAVNSKGNIKDTSYVTRLTLKEANEFINSWGSQIRRYNESSPNLPPGKQFKFESEQVSITGTCK